MSELLKDREFLVDMSGSYFAFKKSVLKANLTFDVWRIAELELTCCFFSSLAEWGEVEVCYRELSTPVQLL